MLKILKENIRDAFIDEVIKIAADEKRIVVLDADVGSATRTWKFNEEYPERFYEFGIAEQNMFGAAAGLASTGCIVIAATFATFASMRAAEMIRTSICYPKMNVKVVGGYAGLSNGKDGATHQSIEDIAIMRSFPNMVVLNPSDPVMTRKIAHTIVEYEGPVYIRMEYENTAAIYNDDFNFEIGKGYIHKEGNDVTIISNGLALARAMEAYEILLAKGIKAEIIDMPTIKPFDEELLLKTATKTGAIVSVEEHSVIGGLSSTICDSLVKSHANPYFKALGIQDLFTESGRTPQLRERYGIGVNDIVNACIQLVDSKRRAE